MVAMVVSVASAGTAWTTTAVCLPYGHTEVSALTACGGTRRRRDRTQRGSGVRAGLDDGVVGDVTGFWGDVFGRVSDVDEDAFDALGDALDVAVADDGLGVNEVVSSETASSGRRNCCLSQISSGVRSN